MSVASSRSTAIQALKNQLLQSPSGGLPRQFISTGLPDVDAILPDHGLPTGAMVEWVSEHSGQFAASVALSFAQRLLTLPGCLAVIDGRHEFHAVALTAAGIPLARLLLIRPGRDAEADDAGSPRSSSPGASTSPFLRSLPTQQADTLWALEQSARCPGVRVALCWLDRVSSTALRRLQLAVERSGATVFLIRPASVLKEPSWSDLRIALRPTRHAEVELRVAHARHQTRQSSVVSLKVDDETCAVCAVSELADSAAPA